MTPEEVVALQSMSDAERVKWLESRKSLLSNQDFVTLRGLNLGGTFSRQLKDPLTEAEERRSLPDRKKDERDTVDKAKADADAAAASAYDAVIAQGGTVVQANRAAESVSSPDGEVFSEYVLPKDIVDAIGVDAQSEEDALRILDSINDLKGTAFVSWDDVASSGMLKSEVERAVISSMVEDADPEEAFTVQTFKGRVSITSQEMGLATQAFGLTPSQISRTAKLAAASGFVNMDGGVAWQPAAALFKAAGFSDWGRTEKQSKDAKVEQDRLAVKIQKDKDRLKTMGGGGEGARALQKQIDADQARYNQMAKGYRDDVNFQPKSTRDGRTPQELSREFNRQLQGFKGDEQMALIGTLNPGLALRIQASGGDPAKLSWQDRDLLGSTVRRAGFTSLDEFAMTLGTLGRGEALDENVSSPLLKRIAELEAALKGGGSQRTRPDPVAIRQSAKDLYQSLYLTDPDEATLDSLSANIQASIAGTPDDMSVSGDARVRDEVEKSPMYAKMYGKKPGGMSEEDYQGMMRSGQESMLGAELAGNQAARLGMQQGDYQTAVGATMGFSEAWDNSTFMGRLARAAQTVSRNT